MRYVWRVIVTHVYQNFKMDVRFIMRDTGRPCDLLRNIYLRQTRSKHLYSIMLPIKEHLCALYPNPNDDQSSLIYAFVPAIEEWNFILGLCIIEPVY